MADTAWRVFKPPTLLVVVVSLAADGSAQTRAVEVHAEAVAVGVSLALPTRSAWTVGADVSAGKHIVVSVTDASARLGVSRFRRRVGLGTELRVVRIAGGAGSGDYWVQWAPVRVSVQL